MMSVGKQECIKTDVIVSCVTTSMNVLDTIKTMTTTKSDKNWADIINLIKEDIELAKNDGCDEDDKQYNLGLDVALAAINKRTRELL